MRLGLSLTLVACSAALVIPCLSLTAADKDAAVKTTTVVSGLDNPSGVALQPKTGHLFIAAHSGVHRLDLSSSKVYDEVTGFSTDIYGKGPKYNIGPLGLAFMGDSHVVVGDGSQPDGVEVVLVFKAGPKPLAKPEKPTDAVFTLGPIKGEESPKGEGNYYGVAVSDKAIFITCNGDDTKGWVARSEIKDGKPGALKPFIATKVATNVDAPVGITFSAHHKELVIGQMGEISIPGDSLLTFYDPETGKLIKSLKTGLNDIAGLAYSPKTGKLYVVDFSWIDTTKGGLYRLDIDGDKVHAEKIVKLDKPTALTFSPDGALYISEFGTAKEGSDKPAGSILKIDAGL